MKKKKLYIDNLHLTKKLNEEYQDFFNTLLNKISEKNALTDFDKSISANIALEQCLEKSAENIPLKEAFPSPLDEYVAKFTKRSAIAQMRKKMCKQDYEKTVIACIWIVFTVSLVLFFLNNLLTGRYLVNYPVDMIIGCAAGAIAFQNYKIKHRIVKRYNFRAIYKNIDIVTVVACVFIKVVSKSNFDITYLLLVISFFVTKKNITPEFESMLKK